MELEKIKPYFNIQNFVCIVSLLIFIYTYLISSGDPLFKLIKSLIVPAFIIMGYFKFKDMELKK